MLDLKKKTEDSIFTEFKLKINEFLTIVEGLDWAPKKPESHHHDFVEDLVSFIRSTIV